MFFVFVLAFLSLLLTGCQPLWRPQTKGDKRKSVVYLDLLSTGEWSTILTRDNKFLPNFKVNLTWGLFGFKWWKSIHLASFLNIYHHWILNGNKVHASPVALKRSSDKREVSTLLCWDLGTSENKVTCSLPSVSPRASCYDPIVERTVSGGWQSSTPLHDKALLLAHHYFENLLSQEDHVAFNKGTKLHPPPWPTVKNQVLQGSLESLAFHSPHQEGLLY